MAEFARVIAHNGLRLRDSPRDGNTLAVLQESDRIEVLGRETWLRVRHGNQIGFVLADHVEPVSPTETPVSPPPANGAPVYTGRVNIIEYSGSAVFRGSPLRIDEEFLPDLRTVEAEAAGAQITIWITSSLREPNKPVSNAIVTPARFSNHHVGHGFDMNLIHGGQFFRSTDLAQEHALPPAVQGFFARLRGHNLRWGKDFSTPDPVHIDNGLNLRHETVFRDKLARLWGNGRA